MKALAKFTAGSSAFFSGYPDFDPGDIDILIIMDDLPAGDTVFHLFDGKKDNLMIRKMSKDGYIQDAINSGVPMRAGKFLVPEFARYIGLTVYDLRMMEKLFNDMDQKHTYERIIYASYLANGGFFLTDEQREKAYQEYKRTRR